MKVYTDEELLSFCLGDASDELRKDIARQSADDEAFRYRLFQIQTITLAVRTAPVGQAKGAKKKRFILAGVVAAASGFFLAGMLLQAHLDFFNPKAKLNNGGLVGDMEVIAPFSWDVSEERVL